MGTCGQARACCFCGVASHEAMPRSSDSRAASTAWCSCLRLARSSSSLRAPSLGEPIADAALLSFLPAPFFGGAILASGRIFDAQTCAVPSIQLNQHHQHTLRRHCGVSSPAEAARLRCMSFASTSSCWHHIGKPKPGIHRFTMLGTRMRKCIPTLFRGLRV